MNTTTSQSKSQSIRINGRRAYPSLIESAVIQIYPEEPTLALPSMLRVSIVPVTRAQYRRVGIVQPEELSHPVFIEHPWTWSANSGNLPATGISYLEATRWIEALNANEGRTGRRRWRLVNDAYEWDMICRAGRGESGFEWWTKADQAKEAWFGPDGVGIPPVQTRRPSPAGLSDLWTVTTWMDGSERVDNGVHEARTIGANWQQDSPRDGRWSSSCYYPVTEQRPTIGLRLVCDDTEKTGELSERDWSDFHWSDRWQKKCIQRDREELARLREEVA